MKKTIHFIGGIALYIGMALVFSSYGNILAHRNINKGIIEKFKTRFLGSSGSSEFRNYDFLFTSSVGYEGQMITEGGYEWITEGTKSLSAEEWIVEGGFSADEPQLQASLRHFYDPTIEDPDERHLKDLLTTIESAIDFDFNPRIDHIEWATRAIEHPYNWTLGKAQLKKALETNDVKERKKLMAYAWRSLGETLHMIADMGCPAHVRDDAHPGLFADYSVIKHFGNSDPYENICEQLTDKMVSWSAGAVDTKLREKFFEAKTVQEIGHELAVYTNKNYFTDQTISGKNVVPRIHPDKTYPSPKLEDCIYDPVDYTYTKKISGHDVILCRDKSYAMPHTAHIDRICVESQAKALMPQIAEAGANAIRLFIPDLKVEITELTENSIKGTVKHTTDAEYIHEIKYNGEIELVKSNGLAKLGVINCEDGKFDASHSIKAKDIDEGSDGLVARILFGGVTVNSHAKRLGVINFSPPLVKFTLKDAAIELLVLYNDSPYFDDDATDFPRLKWDGLSFSTDWVKEEYDILEGWGEGSYTRTISTGNFYGNISPDFSELDFYGQTSVNIRTYLVFSSGEISDDLIIWTQELEVSNLPIDGLPVAEGLSSSYSGNLKECIISAYDKIENYEDGVLNANTSGDHVLINLDDPSLVLKFTFYGK